MDRSATSRHDSAGGRGRIVLAMLAGAALSITGGQLFAPQTAEAQRVARPGGGILNPADQRNEMIDELRKINDRLAKVEKGLDKALDVNVVTMPASFNAQASAPANGD